MGRCSRSDARTTICARVKPSRTHPASIAPPILPAPTSTSVPGTFCKSPVIEDVVMAFPVIPGRAYASPAVSNITASSDSRADLPAQTTNWNAWK